MNTCTFRLHLLSLIVYNWTKISSTFSTKAFVETSTSLEHFRPMRVTLGKIIEDTACWKTWWREIETVRTRKEGNGSVILWLWRSLPDDQQCCVTSWYWLKWDCNLDRELLRGYGPACFCSLRARTVSLVSRVASEALSEPLRGERGPAQHY